MCDAVAAAVAAAKLGDIFGDVIHTARAAAGGGGVNLAAEERLERCNSALRGFEALEAPLRHVAGPAATPLAKRAREALAVLDAMKA